MLGTIVNALAIIGGSLAGFVLKGGISKNMNDTLIKGMSLCVILISILGITGVSSSLESSDILVIIFSIAIGAIIGEGIDIDKRLQNFGDLIERKLKEFSMKRKSRKGIVGDTEDQLGGHSIAEGFVTSSLIFCVGAMAIVGSLDSGLKGDHEILFAKSVIDGISAIAFTSSLGIGVLLSSVSVFLYQGIITLAAGSLKGLLVTTVLNDMTAVGNMLIIGIGLNMLGAARIKVANLLPAIFIPIVYQIIVNFVK